jgi:hypothetical protein
MKYGHFDLDFDDGEVRYDITIPVETTGVSIQTVKLVFHSALSAMHHTFRRLWQSPSVPSPRSRLSPHSKLIEKS